MGKHVIWRCQFADSDFKFMEFYALSLLKHKKSFWDDQYPETGSSILNYVSFKEPCFSERANTSYDDSQFAGYDLTFMELYALSLLRHKHVWGDQSPDTGSSILNYDSFKKPCNSEWTNTSYDDVSSLAMTQHLYRFLLLYYQYKLLLNYFLAGFHKGEVFQLY
jgi:hypothetical protein